MGRKKRVSDQQILDALDGMGFNQTQESIAKKLGISSSALSQRMSKMKDKIVSHVDVVLGKRAVYFANDLIEQSKAGKVEATKTAFAMLGKFRNKNEYDLNIEEVRNEIRKEIQSEIEAQAD